MSTPATCATSGAWRRPRLVLSGLRPAAVDQGPFHDAAPGDESGHEEGVLIGHGDDGGSGLGVEDQCGTVVEGRPATDHGVAQAAQPLAMCRAHLSQRFGVVDVVVADQEERHGRAPIGLPAEAPDSTETLDRYLGGYFDGCGALHFTLGLAPM